MRFGTETAFLIHELNSASEKNFERGSLRKEM
jgi:hypothetical protein